MTRSVSPSATPDAGYALPRRGTNVHMTLLFALALALSFIVNQLVVHVNDTSLPLDQLVAAMETQCAALQDEGESVAVAEGATTDLPPSSYGVAVWVDDARWVDAVHDTLDVMDARLVAAQAGVVATPAKRLLHRVVRLHTTALRELRAANQSYDDAALWGALGNVARQQQLGLPVLQHAFQPDLHLGMTLLSVSVFTLPAATADVVHCDRFDAGKYYCALAHNATTSAVPVALSSVLANELGTTSFRDAAALTRWHAAREARACRHAAHALRVLQHTLSERSDMAAPREAHAIVDTVRRHAHQGAFVQAAHAADSLEYHPLLMPQIYVPWDTMVLLHITVLQPFIAALMLGLRFTNAERRRRKKQSAAQPSLSVHNTLTQ